MDEQVPDMFTLLVRNVGTQGYFLVTCSKTATEDDEQTCVIGPQSSGVVSLVDANTICKATFMHWDDDKERFEHKKTKIIGIKTAETRHETCSRLRVGDGVLEMPDMVDLTDAWKAELAREMKDISHLKIVGRKNTNYMHTKFLEAEWDDYIPIVSGFRQIDNFRIDIISAWEQCVAYAVLEYRADVSKLEYFTKKALDCLLVGALRGIAGYYPGRTERRDDRTLPIFTFNNYDCDDMALAVSALSHALLNGEPSDTWSPLARTLAAHHHAYYRPAVVVQGLAHSSVAVPGKRVVNNKNVGHVWCVLLPIERVAGTFLLVEATRITSPYADMSGMSLDTSIQVFGETSAHAEDGAISGPAMMDLTRYEYAVSVYDNKHAYYIPNTAGMAKIEENNEYRAINRSGWEYIIVDNHVANGTPVPSEDPPGYGVPMQDFDRYKWVVLEGKNVNAENSLVNGAYASVRHVCSPNVAQKIEDIIFEHIPMFADGWKNVYAAKEVDAESTTELKVTEFNSSAHVLRIAPGIYHLFEKLYYATS